MEFLFPLSMLGVGLIIGAVSLWLITRAKLKYEFERGRAAATTEHATLVERLSGKEDQVRQLREALDRETSHAEELRNETSRTAAQLSALQTRLEDERRVNQEKLVLLTNAEEKLADAFKALSADALRNNNQSFLDLAKQNLQSFQQTAKGELERRQNAIDDLIKPLKESLEKVDGKIGELEKNRVGAYSELREQVKALADELGKVHEALRIGGFGIDTRLDRPFGSVLHVGVHPVPRDEFVDREIVADDCSLESPLLLQNVVQQP